MWCIQKITGEYRKRMYRILKIYQQKPDNRYPLICMDEKSKQLLENTRDPIKAKPGKREKYDGEYERKGTCNIFVVVAPKTGKRVIKVTNTRTKKDFAYFLKELIKKHFPKAERIQLVLDNLNTHFAKSLIETFGEEEAAKFLDRITFIHTPKHASWLNMAEIEINVMDRQCTGGRIANQELLKSEVTSWSKSRNKKHCRIEWTFRRQDADKKLSKHYVT